MTEIRPAAADDLDALAQLWCDGWRDAHADILPEALARHRTREDLRARLQANLAVVRVAGPRQRALGFSIVHGDELNQLFVTGGARGSGVAAALLADAEARIAATGACMAWLTCAIGNARAARFYEKHGWRRIGVVTSQLPTSDGPFPLEVWRYEKELPPAQSRRR